MKLDIELTALRASVHQPWGAIMRRFAKKTDIKLNASLSGGGRNLRHGLTTVEKYKCVLVAGAIQFGFCHR